MIYFGILIALGLKNTSNYKSYWDQTSKLLKCNRISKSTRYKRFVRINSFITCISELEYPSKFSRRIKNTPKIIQFLNDRFSRYYHPRESLSIDESVIPFKGNVQFKTYNPNKPDKYGIKAYMCSDSTSTYIYKIKLCYISSKLKEPFSHS